MATRSDRRSFILKLGTGATAGVASTLGLAAGTPVTAHQPARDAGLLEDELALRRFHQSFENAMDKGLHEEVIGMFADDARVVFNGGLFTGRNQGVSRLYRERFAAGRTGGWMEPAPGFELTAEQQRDSVTISPDRLAATAIFPYSIQVGAPMDAESSLVAMARLHGEGIQTWWEGGVYRITYQKNAADGRWQISRLEYDTLSRADWRPGRSYAQPVAVARFSKRFPADQQGPDAVARLAQLPQEAGHRGDETHVGGHRLHDHARHGVIQFRHLVVRRQ